MFKRLHPLLSVLAIALVTTTLAACGGDSPKTIPSNSVALVGSTPITKATLNHWMNSIVGGDFWERFQKRAPIGLVSEPANYATCEAGAKTLTATSKRKPPFTSAEISQKCHQLYLAIREQSLLFLINVLWRIEESKEKGITVSDAEAAKNSHEYSAKFYPKPGQYEAFLANHEWAASDELYQIKRNLLTTKLREQVTGRSSQKEETPQGRAKFMSYVVANIKKRTAETRCRADYAVSTCRGYKEPASAIPPPVTILEELVGE